MVALHISKCAAADINCMVLVVMKCSGTTQCAAADINCIVLVVMKCGGSTHQ